MRKTLVLLLIMLTISHSQNLSDSGWVEWSKDDDLALTDTIIKSFAQNGVRPVERYILEDLKKNTETAIKTEKNNYRRKKLNAQNKRDDERAALDRLDDEIQSFASDTSVVEGKIQTRRLALSNLQSEIAMNNQKKSEVDQNFKALISSIYVPAVVVSTLPFTDDDFVDSLKNQLKPIAQSMAIKFVNGEQLISKSLISNGVQLSDIVTKKFSGRTEVIRVDDHQETIQNWDSVGLACNQCTQRLILTTFFKVFPLQDASLEEISELQNVQSQGVKMTGSERIRNFILTQSEALNYISKLESVEGQRYKSLLNAIRSDYLEDKYNANSRLEAIVNNYKARIRYIEEKKIRLEREVGARNQEITFLEATKDSIKNVMKISLEQRINALKSYKNADQVFKEIEMNEPTYVVIMGEASFQGSANKTYAQIVEQRIKEFRLGNESSKQKGDIRVEDGREVANSFASSSSRALIKSFKLLGKSSVSKMSYLAFALKFGYVR